jgi:hypothetical protein
VKKITCPVCRKSVNPVRFELWPGAAVDICPDCRIGVGVLTDAKVKAANKKLVKVRGK